MVQTESGPVRLPLRARCRVNQGTVYLPDGRHGPLLEGSVREMPEVQRAAADRTPDAWAWSAFAGAPYQWGGVTPLGVDCSGMVQTTFAARGVSLPRDAWQQAALGVPVAAGALAPGDLCFFRGEATDRISHVALYAGNDAIVHSTVACGSVVRERWAPGCRAAALRERLLSARRLATAR